MANLNTTYLGLNLKNPIIASPSPLWADLDNIKKLEEAGAAAVILPSLFEEQIELDNLGPAVRYEALLPEELKHIPNLEDYNQGANGYLSLVYRAKRAVNIPVIGSLNGYYSGGWIQYARLIEAAGADALELNIYYLAAKPQTSSNEVEQMHVDLVQQVADAIKIPVAVKLSPYFTALTHLALRLQNAGANALVLFNRFYQPDIDLDTKDVVPSLDLSNSAELRLRLRWVAILSTHLQKSQLAVTGGVHSGQDVVKSLLAGAKVAMMTSAILDQGIDYVATVLAELEAWLDANEFETVTALQGQMNQEAVKNPAAFERANYLNVLKSN